MNEIDVQLRETRTAKLLEFDEAKRRSELFEKLRSEMEQQLEQKRLELAAEHEAIATELKAENAVRIEKLKLDFRMEVSVCKLLCQNCDFYCTDRLCMGF
jgi:formylmethanofuran dehydrogenase subunit E